MKRKSVIAPIAKKAGVSKWLDWQTLNSTLPFYKDSRTVNTRVAVFK